MEGSTLNVPVRLMAHYNLWANRCYAEYFSTLSDHLLRHEVGGSFPSLYLTLLHIWDAQDVWYRRLQGENPTRFLSDGWHGSTTELLNGLVGTSKAFSELASSLDDTQMQEVFTYVTFASGPQKSRRYEVLLHVFNHSMYHRGQCVTMARILGLDNVPGTDLIRYLRTHENVTG